ncbi:MAG: (Fe-S)-binding protein [Rhodothermales bacterium]
MIDNPIDVAERCRHSLMCRHVCPIGNLTHNETLSPHGWAQLISLERRGLSTWNEETVDALYACADCGSCRAHCVTSQALPEAIAAARAEVVERQAAPAVVYEMEAQLRKWENPHVQEKPVPADDTSDVALFVGDDVHFLRPSVLEAALKLLAAVGVEPALFGKGRSTGYLASSLGLPDLARDLADTNVEELNATGARKLFVLTPGAYFAFGQMYDERLGLRMPSGVELMEVVPFLAAKLEAGDLHLDKSDDAVAYAYVDPTHAVRVPDRHEAPRRLLGAVLQSPPKELFWRNERAYPCGNLALAFTQPALSQSLTEARLKDAVDVEAHGVITEDAGSLVHLEKYAPSFDLRVQGFYELLAAHLAS